MMTTSATRRIILAFRGILLMSLLLLCTACGFFGAGADERAPRLDLISPAPGDTVGGVVLVQLTGEAFGGPENTISQISIHLNNTAIGNAEFIEVEGSTEPRFVYRWNSLDFPDGVYDLEAVAFDQFQSRGISARIEVNVRNESPTPGPSVAILSPDPSAKVSGFVTVIASPADAGPPLSGMDFMVDGVTVFKAKKGPFIYAWNTEDLPLGVHILQVRAYSSPDVFSYSDPLEIIVTDDPADGPSGNTDPGTLRFLTTGFSGEVQGSVAVGFNNDLYLATLADTLYAYSPTGTLRWTYSTQGPLRSSPVVDGSENIFVASDDGHLYGVDQTGRELWRPFNVGALPSMPALGTAGDLFFGDGQGRLHRFDTFSGSPFSGWPINVSSAGIVVPPVISEQGLVIVASLDGSLYGISDTGNVLWQSPNLGSIQAGLAIVNDLTTTRIYTISGNGTLYALNGGTGSILWQYRFQAQQTGAIRSAPIVGPDGTIYVGTSAGLISLTPSGTLNWRFAAPDVGTAAIDTNGQIYFVSANRLLAIRSNNTPVWSFNLQGVADGPVTLRRDGTLLVAANNNILYAINSDSQGLARSNWPMFQRNGRHTGRIGLDGDDGAAF